MIIAEAGTSVACSTVAGASLPVIEPGHVHLRDTTAHVEGHKEREFEPRQAAAQQDNSRDEVLSRQPCRSQFVLPHGTNTVQESIELCDRTSPDCPTAPCAAYIRQDQSFCVVTVFAWPVSRLSCDGHPQIQQNLLISNESAHPLISNVNNHLSPAGGYLQKQIVSGASTIYNRQVAQSVTATGTLSHPHIENYTAGQC